MYSIFYSVLPIFLIAFLGSIIRRKWLTSDEFWRGLEKLSFYVLFPAVLFEHSAKVDLASFTLLRLVIALIVATAIVAFGLVLYQNRRNFHKVHFTSVFQGSTRYNNYIFFAVGAALFGDEGLSIIATISPYLIIFTNLIVVIAFVHYIPTRDGVSGRKGLMLVIKSVITNPFIIASLLGFIFNYFQIELNKGIENTIHNIADSALSIGIMIVGASLKFRINPEYFNYVVFAGVVKLVIMPIITFIILWLMAIGGTAKSVGILCSCLPCASSAYILSRQLGGDPETMSAIITFTTIFSILSLSILVYILG
ncbi:MAG: AEC family transporter [Rickettsiaceae bacterium]|nr:AEC family transporter [Rickettsiaceae bacterium]